MTNSLYARLSLVFLLILLCLGAFILWHTHKSSQRYFLEFTQVLNQPIAMYMADNAKLVDENGLNTKALEDLAPHVMMINPSAEVYLLDTAGKIVAHSLTDENLPRTRVSMSPIRHFLEGKASFPLLGDNPMNRGEQRIFSAHPLKLGGKVHGYVYVILAGEQHETLLNSIAESHSYKSLAYTLGSALLLAIAAGFILFFKLTRRLQRLRNQALHWQQNLQLANLSDVKQPSAPQDEIDELTLAYTNMAQRLIEQNQRLLQIDRDRREFYANISHDLRTPLTTLQGYLETILINGQGLPDNEQQRHFEIALKQSRRLQSLISQLFELNQYNSQHYKLQHEPFSLLELSYDIVEDFKPVAQQKNISLSVQHEEASTGSLVVDADIALIQRVFENIINNALRHTPEHGSITLIVKRELAVISVAIEDTGEGMPGDCERALERYYSFDQQNSRQIRHAGLGLAIVQGILSLHKGTLRIKSQRGLGTSVTFALPIARAHDNKQHSIMREPESARKQLAEAG